MNFVAPELIKIPEHLRDAKLCRKFGKTPEGKAKLRHFVAEMQAIERFLEENLKTAREAMQLARAALGEVSA